MYQDKVLFTFLVLPLHSEKESLSGTSFFSTSLEFQFFYMSIAYDNNLFYQTDDLYAARDSKWVAASTGNRMNPLAFPFPSERENTNFFENTITTSSPHLQQQQQPITYAPSSPVYYGSNKINEFSNFDLNEIGGSYWQDEETELHSYSGSSIQSYMIHNESIDLRSQNPLHEDDAKSGVSLPSPYAPSIRDYSPSIHDSSPSIHDSSASQSWMTSPTMSAPSVFNSKWSVPSFNWGFDEC